MASRPHDTLSAGAEGTTTGALPWWSLPVVCVAWLGLWCLTPGLLSNGVGHLFTDDFATSVLIETLLTLVLALVLVVAHRRYNRVLFARSWSIWLYALPIALAIALPFHYRLILPVFLYLVWMIVSVFWQDYLTFGLLQNYLGERLSTWVVIVASAVIFWLTSLAFGRTQRSGESRNR